MTTTWSTTDKNAGVTLSGGNLVASFAASNQGVRSIDRVYNGKYYWECTFTTTLNTVIGICNGTSPFSTMGSTTGLATTITNGGAIFNPTNTGNVVGGTVTNGWVCCIALDATAGIVWFRNGAAGNWDGNAAHNPATGVGGYSVSAYAAPNFTGLYFCAQGGSGSGVVTANFGATAFVGTPPSGFASGFPSGTTMVMAEAATQIAAEQWAGGTPAVQATQLLVEQWAAVSLTNPQMVATQIALEQWASVLAATANKAGPRWSLIA